MPVYEHIFKTVYCLQSSGLEWNSINFQEEYFSHPMAIECFGKKLNNTSPTSGPHTFGQATMQNVLELGYLVRLVQVGVSLRAG